MDDLCCPAYVPIANYGCIEVVCRPRPLQHLAYSQLRGFHPSPEQPGSDLYHQERELGRAYRVVWSMRPEAKAQ